MSAVSCVFYLTFLIVLSEYFIYIKANGKDSLVSLLQLHEEHCGFVPSCRFRSKTDDEVKERSSQSCCFNCSCEEDCVRQGTCCPDFWQNSTIDAVSSTTVEEFQDRLEEVNFTNGQFDNSTQNTEELTDCYEATTQFINFDPSRRRNSYKVITSCTRDLQHSENGSTSACTGSFQEKLKTHDNLPSLLTPVTSLKTNRTYKNIYCLKCNEIRTLREEVAYWRIMYTCSENSFSSAFAYDFMVNPYNLFRQATSVSACYLVFQPRKHIDDFVNRCDPVDVDTCPTDSDKQLEHICKKYYLPVNGYSTGYITYKNIACYMCNRKTAFQAVCKNMQQSFHDSSSEINILLDGDIFLLYNESDSHVLNVSIGNKNKDHCEQGFIQNDKTMRCRRILCPRNFYPLQGSCVPTFSHMENTYFTILLEARTYQDKEFQQMELFNFYQMFLLKINESASGLYDRFTFGLWRLTNMKSVLVFSFIPLPTDVTYVDTLVALSRFLEGTAFFRIETNSTTVRTVMFISKDMNLIFTGGKLKIRGNKKSLFPYENYQSLGNTAHMSEVRISCSHICYRTELEASEVFVNIRSQYYINRNKTWLHSSDVSSLANGGYAVCLDDVYPNLKNASSSYMFGGINAYAWAEVADRKFASRSKPTGKDLTKQDTEISGLETDPDTPDDLWNGLVIGVVIVSVCATVCVVRFMRKRIVRRRGRETPSVQFTARPKAGPSLERNLSNVVDNKNEAGPSS